MDEDALRGFISKVSPPRWGFWLVSTLPALLLLAMVGASDIFPVFQVWRHAAVTSGVITAKECGERKRVAYQYRVENRLYSGEGKLRDTALRCTDVSVGMLTPVTYNALNPAASVPTQNSTVSLKRRIRALAIGMSVAYVGTLLALWIGVWFGRQLRWG